MLVIHLPWASCCSVSLFNILLQDICWIGSLCQTHRMHQSYWLQEAIELLPPVWWMGQSSWLRKKRKFTTNFNVLFYPFWKRFPDFYYFIWEWVSRNFKFQWCLKILNATRQKKMQLSENFFNFYNLRLWMQTASVYLHQHFFACFQSQVGLTSKVLLGALIVQFPSLIWGRSI